jgi:hypothetical protein
VPELRDDQRVLVGSLRPVGRGALSETQIAPTLNVFLDESGPKPVGGGRKRLLVSCVVCEKERWVRAHPTAQQIGGLLRKRRLDAIENALKEIGAFGVVAYADLSGTVIIPGVRDGTSDIQRMARTDVLWSQVFLGAVAIALACLRKASVKQASMRVFHDPRSLRPDHRDAVHGVLTQLLPSLLQEDPETGQIDPTVHFECTAFTEVPKWPPSPLQTGTALAHYLCEQSARVIKRGNRGPLLARNVTEQVMEMVSPFLGRESVNEESCRGLGLQPVP